MDCDRGSNICTDSSPCRTMTGLKSSAKYFRMASFSNVIGCIDCTHISIIEPSVNEHEFINRKGVHPINVQSVCNADMHITNTEVKWPGKRLKLNVNTLYQQFPQIDKFLLYCEITYVLLFRLHLTHLVKEFCLLDGTSRAVSEPFIQLLSIHSFIKSGTRWSKFPFVLFWWLVSKKIEYSVIFRTIIGLLSTEPAVKKIIVDFERAVWPAFGRCFPAVIAGVCWSIGHQLSTGDWRSIVIYAPENWWSSRKYYEHTSMIEPAFRELKVRGILAERLKKIVKYMEKTWINSHSRPSVSCSAFKGSVRTNNDAQF